MLDRNFEPDLQEHLSAGRTLQVLVVDDSKVVRAAIRERLELGNLAVTEASGGEQALALIEQWVPDLVLLDLMMPGLDGIAVLTTLRQSYNKHQLPVIPVTSGDACSDIVRVLDLGANDYITKPIDFDVLWARLSNQLMQKRAAEYLRHAQASIEQQIRCRTAELNSSNQRLKRLVRQKLLAEDRLQRQANYDALTGLPNRSLATDRLGQTIAKAKRQKRKPGVAFLDLDDFKKVNDTLGHAAGDQLLKQAARRLSACARKSDTVARLGGDEFLLILEDTGARPRDSRESDLRRVGKRIIESFSRPFVLDGNKVNVSPSLGFAVFPGDGHNGDELIRHADAAMYRAKKHGKNSCCFYSSGKSTGADMRSNVESALRSALEKGELCLHYQPVVDLAGGKIVNAEALLRWRNPGMGMVSPAYFIKVAEESGLIVPIGDWVIRTACKQLRIWRESGWSQLRMSVNVSFQQLMPEAELNATILDALDSNGLQAEALQLEFAEEILMREACAAQKVMAGLEDNGIRILIDDFGTGYAPLSYLQRNGVESVKIDRRYITKAEDNARKGQSVKAIVAMASNLGLSVICEGVETAGQVDLLRDAHCHFAQGYYFSRPLPSEEFSDLLNKQSIRSCRAELPAVVPGATGLAGSPGQRSGCL